MGQDQPYLAHSNRIQSTSYWNVNHTVNISLVVHLPTNYFPDPDSTVVK